MVSLDKFTQKTQEALSGALQFAQELEHQQIEPEHLLVSLLQDKEGIVFQILEKINVSPQKYIQDPIALKILQGEIKEHDHVEADLDKKTNEFKFVKGKAA